MMFQSILGVNQLDKINPEDIKMPRFFYDLNLDQIVQDIMDGQKLYDLRRFYYYKASGNDITYRQEVLKDLDNAEVYQQVVDFSIGIRKAKEYLSYIEGCENELQIEKWNLDAAHSYITSILKFHKDLLEGQAASAGLTSFREWLGIYINSEEFVRLKEDTERLLQRFDTMKFHFKIKRDRVIISTGFLEEDYCRQLSDTFRETPEESHYYQKNPFGTTLLSSLEVTILGILKRQYAEVFAELEAYDRVHQDFIHQTISEFELESQFYIAFCIYREKMKEIKFHFCYPEVHPGEQFRISKGYDLALAKKNAQQDKEVVFNDCYFSREEKFFVITGPNQGGKTTFARALGQIVYFGSIGLMVPCETAGIPVFDGIYTHFAVEENLDTGAGKLKEELIRLKDLMSNVTRHSFVIINEVFTSATSYDAFIMGKKVIDYFLKEDCLGVYVTHIYELTKGDGRIISLVACLLDEESNIRTFKIERKPADGRSYANTIAGKHHLTYQEIKERLRK